MIPPLPPFLPFQHAQFRPHRDNGAGAGQSTSLIVGLGDYAGGRVVVEGDENDVQFKALEFNGWTQVSETQVSETQVQCKQCSSHVRCSTVAVM